jgi:hypothetical protein
MMVDDYSIFPKLNPLPSVENPRDSVENPLQENRRKKKGKKKGISADEAAQAQEEVPDPETDPKHVGKVLDIKV